LDLGKVNPRGGARLVLESLGEVYANDEVARAQGMSSERRLHFHQEDSGRMMETLHAWHAAQFDEKKGTELGARHGHILLTQILGQTYSVSAATGSTAP
jgi:hypothetical protein